MMQGVMILENPGMRGNRRKMGKLMLMEGGEVMGREVVVWKEGRDCIKGRVCLHDGWGCWRVAWHWCMGDVYMVDGVPGG